MNAVMYDNAVAMFTLGELRWTQDTFKLALYTDAYQPDQRGHTSRGQVLGEVAVSGTYSSGGQELTSLDVVRGDVGDVVLEAKGVEWAGFTGAWRYGIIYQANGSEDRDMLVAYQDFGPQQATNTTVSVDFDGGVAGFLIARDGLPVG